MARAWFQQDGATVHTEWLSVNTLCAAFPGQLLSRFGDIQWPSNSPDLTAADLFYGGIWKPKLLLTPSLTLTALKMQFIRRMRMLCRTLYIASWLVYLEDGSNALIVMEDISKTLYWWCEAFFVNLRHWLTSHFPSVQSIYTPWPLTPAIQTEY
jgi:hypothetical protein